ncbi:MAG TPA: hypothetical protein VF628_13305 [Allosphingosinicella sp.]|jgi:hypothetical protein
MKHTPITSPQPAIQLLIIACSAFGPPPERCAWLHGFCILTLRPGSSPILVQARVATGERHSDDRPLIEKLMKLLDPDATLAGLDLTSMLGKLGRLPIDATDQAPALELLDRLETMIGANPPIDLALSAEARGHVARHAQKQQLGIAERIGDGSGSALFGIMDNANPAALALMMAETADTCALALAEMKWSQPRMAALLHERLRWRKKLLSRLSRAGD